MKAESVWRDVEAIRAKAPLVHNITNYVVMNSTANVLLAIGASPVMAHAEEEVEDMVALASKAGGALVINMGTLSERWITSMERAMKASARLGVPIVLDPVGAGATRYRTETAHRLLSTARPTVVRGNASEIMAIAGVSATTKGVDSAHGAGAARAPAREAATRLGTVVVVSGAVDFVTDGRREGECPLGHPLMTRVTGMGCAATALIGAFCAVNRDPFEAALHAMAVMGLCGERAAARAEGPGSMQVHFLDELAGLSLKVVKERLG